jgi:uncharacterized damage-inducible protein DinB
MNHSLKEILIRDLNTLRNEISSFEKEENLWKILPGIKNPAGILCSHICGNLNHFIGAMLGNSGYIRNRDNEFTQTGISKDNLIGLIDQTVKMIHESFTVITNELLQQKYPAPFAGKEVNTGVLLLILITHLSYHLGQINYLRRILN